MNVCRLGALFLTTALLPVSVAVAQDATITEEGFLGTIEIGEAPAQPAAPVATPRPVRRAPPVAEVPVFAETPALVPTRIDTVSAQSTLGNELITPEEIASRNPARISDVFAGESSISVSGGAAVAQKVFVNGIEESLLNVTIDGARQNKTPFHHAGNVLIDPFLLNRVTVSEGLAPADAGQGALAGAISYETKDAGDLLDEGDTFGGTATVSGSNNGLGGRGSLAVYGVFGDFEYVLSGTRHIAQDYADGTGTVVPGTNANVLDLMGKVAYETNGHRFEFSASDTRDTGTRQAQGGPGGLLFARPDFAGVNGRPSTPITVTSERRSYNFVYTNEQPTGWFAPTVQMSYNTQDLDVGGVEGSNTSLSGKVQNQFTLNNGTVTAGVDFYRETMSGSADAPISSSGSEMVYDIGVYAQVRQDVTDFLSLSYGGRYDYQWFTGADGSKFTAGGFSGNAQADFALTSNLSFNVGVASTFGGYELGEPAVVNLGGPWNYAGLAPSRSTAARAGLRYQDQNWVASAAVFYTKVNNVSAILPTAGARGALTDVTSYGFDGGISYYADNGFASLNYTYANVTSGGAPITSTSYYLGRPVGHIFKAEVGYDVTDTFAIGADAELAFPDTANNLGGYNVLNAHATYRPRSLDNFEVRFDVANVFNSTYVSRSSDGNGLPMVVPLTEPGRTFGLTASLRF